MTAIDLDAPPAPPASAPTRRRASLPWILFGATAGALVASLIFQLPRPVSADPAPPPSIGPMNPTISGESSGGLSRGPTVYRDPAGAVVAVVLPVKPYAEETITCSLVVAGEVVTAEGTDGYPAVCVWLATPDPPGR